MAIRDLAIIAVATLGMPAFAAGPGEAPAAPAPPTVTTDRLATAIDAFLPEQFRGSLTIRTASVVSKPSGKDREEETEVQRFTRHGDGSGESVIVSATENGKDVTEKRRQEHEKRQQAEQQSEGSRAQTGDSAKKDKHGSGMRLPAGEDLAIYAFSAPTETEGLLVASFEPLPGHRKDDEVMKGRLAWHADTLDPAWIELSFADPPTGLQEMLMRFDLARVGDALFVRHMVTDGVGGMLFIKRRFHAEMEITDLQPDPPAAP
jgi:hypothetical protein